MPTIAEIEQELIEDFDLLENWEEKYEYLVELGQEMPEMPPDLKTSDRLVQGCQSSVWFDVTCRAGRLYFVADSDSLIVRGIVAVLTRVLNSQTAADVLAADLSFFERLGLWRHLSSQRSNGLTAMLAHLKKAAVDCLAEPNTGCEGCA